MGGKMRALCPRSNDLTLRTSESSDMHHLYSRRVALVTGGTRGIGRAITLALADAGASVAAVYLANRAKAAELEDELKPYDVPHLILQADVRDFQQIESAMSQVEQHLGKIHFLVNNAGINRDKSFKHMDMTHWEQVIATNLTGVFNCCRAGLNHMALEEGSRIVNVSSIIGETGNFGQVNYSAAKSGLLGFTKSLARELARHHVTVNAIAPGFTGTDMFAEIPADIQARIIRDIPLGRVARPEEIAHAVSFLCSEKAGFITGAVLDINGGMYM
jgi:3-oxoacyl-[acyl-carrier protein] reductase